MKKHDRMIGIISLIFSGLIIFETSRIPTRIQTSYEPGPTFLPFWVGVAIAILSILLIVYASRLPAETESETIFPDRQGFIRIGLLVATLVAYTALLNVLGYMICTLFANIFLMRFVMQAKWKFTLWQSVLITFLLTVTFGYLMEGNLPQNIFGF
jgi:Mg2+/Co2+ transporter CorB